MTMLDERTTTREEIKTTDTPGEATHIVLMTDEIKRAFGTPQAYVLAARIEGFPVTALCGYTWVPQSDPKNFPICSRCLEIYQQPGEHRDERDDLPDA